MAEVVKPNAQQILNRLSEKWQPNMPFLPNDAGEAILDCLRLIMDLQAQVTRHDEETGRLADAAGEEIDKVRTQVRALEATNKRVEAAQRRLPAYFNDPRAAQNHVELVERVNRTESVVDILNGEWGMAVQNSLAALEAAQDNVRVLASNMEDTDRRTRTIATDVSIVKDNIEDFGARLKVLEIRTSDMGNMGRIVRRIEALEQAPTVTPPIVEHEVRLKVLEAAAKAEPAPLAEPGDTGNDTPWFTLPRAEHERAGKALMLAESTLYQGEGESCVWSEALRVQRLIGEALDALGFPVRPDARLDENPAQSAKPDDEGTEDTAWVTVERQNYELARIHLMDIIERSSGWERLHAKEVYRNLFSSEPHEQSAGPLPVKSDPDF